MAQTIIAGKEVQDRYLAILNGAGNSEELCKRQERASREGITEAELVKSMYGWSLRYASGLNDFGLIARARETGATWAKAVEYAKEWQAKDPERRFVTCCDPLAGLGAAS